MHDQGVVGCAYAVVEVCTAKNCKPAELCPLGWIVYRRWAGGGHHHHERIRDE